MTNIYVLCGIPGSGKTTFGGKLAEQHNAVLHSYDDMVMANTWQSVDGSVKRAWIENMKADLAEGCNIVCDGLLLTSKDREQILKEFDGISCRKILVVLSTPLEICLERNRNRKARLPDFVIRQSHQRYEAPQENENWDEIIFL